MLFKLFNFLFNWQYVLLIDFSRDMLLRRAYRLNGVWYANPYSSKTRTELKPGGETYGQGYIRGWRPVTRDITAFFADREVRK